VRSQRGFTLIELMVSLVLFAVVTAGLLSVAVTMANGYSDQEVTVDTETSSRASIDFISDALRGASPGVPLNTIINLDKASCDVGAISVENNIPSLNPTVYGNTSDKLTMVYASGSVVTTLASAYTGPGTVTVVDGSQFAVDDFVVITNLDTGHLMHVSAVLGNQLTFDSNLCLTPNLPVGGYAVGSLVVRAQRASFFIDAIDGVPVLMMDADADGARFAPEPIAEGIEDLEVALGVDSNADGKLTNTAGTASEDNTTVNGDEWIGNFAGELPASPTVFVPTTSLRAVRISLVARTAREYTGVNTFNLGALEDRAANAGTDNYRRRALSTIVEIRNLGGSP